MQTKGKIGAIYTFPTKYTPDDCLSCEGYSLAIVDYKDLYKVIGTKFNQTGDLTGTFRIPDYNITKRFLQPGSSVGDLISAGLPNISGSWAAGSGSSASGAAYISGTRGGEAGGGGGTDNNVVFNASRSSSIYGNSTTVQPPSQIVHLCIKYK
ncbi:MAG: tail fiber protein [Bacteroidales bacterium]|nr:tail fiber protein [Bacteroidales bacterium]